MKPDTLIHSPTSRRRGSVYILVVAVLVLLALIGTAFVTTARVDRQSVGNYADNTQFSFSTEQVVSEAVDELLGDLFGVDSESNVLVYRGYGNESFDSPLHEDLFEQIDVKPDPFLASRVPVDLELVWDGAKLALVPDASSAAPAWSSITAPLLGGQFGAPSRADEVTTNSDISVPIDWNDPDDVADALTVRQPVGFWPGVAVKSDYPDGTTLVAPMLSYVWEHEIAPGTKIPVYGQIFAADADGDGVADSGLEPLNLDLGNGLSYYVGFRIIDHNSALNASVAWTPNADATLPGNYFPSHVSLPDQFRLSTDTDATLLARHFATPDSQMAALNMLRADGIHPTTPYDAASYFALTEPIDADADGDGFLEPILRPEGWTSGAEAWTVNVAGTTDVGEPYTYTLLPGGQEELWVGLGSRLGNPGYRHVDGTRYQAPAVADAIALASRFTLSRQDPYVSAGGFSQLEQSLRPTLLERTRSKPYEQTPAGIVQWFAENFSYWTEGNGSLDAFTDMTPVLSPETPGTPATYRNRRALITTMNGVANHANAALADATAQVAPHRGMMAYAALGAWDPTVQYQPGDVVWDEAPTTGNSGDYICINANGSLGSGGATGERPSDDTAHTYWTDFDLLLYPDYWDDTTDYAQYAMVRYKSGLYLCIDTSGTNAGSEPDAFPLIWAPVESPWNPTFNYPSNAMVLHEGTVYISLTGWNPPFAMDNIANQPDLSPDFWRPVDRPPVRKANINHAHFRELWRAFYNVMAGGSNQGFPFDQATAGYVAAAKARDEFDPLLPTDSVLPKYTFHDPFIGNKFNEMLTDVGGVDVAVYEPRGTDPADWSDPRDTPQHPARMFRSPIRHPPYDTSVTPGPDYDAQTKRLSPKQVTVLRSALAAVNVEDLRDSDFTVTERKLKLYTPRVVRGTVSAVHSLNRFDVTFTTVGDEKYDDYYQRGDWTFRFPGTHTDASLRGEDREIKDYDYDGATATIEVDEDFDVNPSGDFFLINTNSGVPVDVTAFGYEPQPFITEVYADTNPTRGPEGYVAVELYNPYDFPMYLGHSRLARIDRQRRATTDVMARHLVFDTMMNGALPFDFTTATTNNAGSIATRAAGFIPAKGYLILENYDVGGTGATDRSANSGLLSAGGIDNPDANFVFVPNLGDVIEAGVSPPGQELVLLRPRWASLAYDVSDLDGNGTPGGYVLRFDIPAGITVNTWDMVPMDQFDFTGMTTTTVEEWHYVRENGVDLSGVDRAWRFVYPGRYNASGATTGPISLSNSAPMTYGRHHGTISTGHNLGTFPPSPPVGSPSVIPVALGAADSRASYPDPVTIQLWGNDAWKQIPSGGTTLQFVKEWPGPNAVSLAVTVDDPTAATPAVLGEMVAPVKFPFGGFSRVGDVLQVPFIGAYRMKHSEPDDEPDPLDPAVVAMLAVADGFIVEMNSLPMDAAMAEDTDATSPGEDKNSNEALFPLPDWAWDDLNGNGVVDPGEGEDFDGDNAASAGEGEDLNDDNAITAELNTENALEQVGRFCPILNDFDSDIRDRTLSETNILTATTVEVPSLIDPAVTVDRYDNYLVSVTFKVRNTTTSVVRDVTRVRTVIDFAPATGTITLDYDLYGPDEAVDPGRVVVEMDRRRYRWAKDLFEYFTTHSPGQDYLPDLPTAKEWTPNTPYSQGEIVQAYGKLWIRRADIDASGTLTAADYWHVSPSPIPPESDPYWGAPVWHRIERQPIANGAVIDPRLANGLDEAKTPVEGLININTAPAVVLAALPMVVNPATGVPDGGAVLGTTYADLNRRLAQAIAYFRDIDADLATPGFQPNGPFRSVMELNKVPGFQKGMGTVRPFSAVFDTTVADTDFDPDDAHGDLTPYNPIDTDTANDLDGVYNDFEHQWLMVNRISNLVTLRSDVYTCYLVVQGWKDANRTDTAPKLVEEKRYAFILDRTGLSPTSREIKIIPVPVE